MKTRKRLQFNLKACFRNASGSIAWGMLCLGLCVAGSGVSATAREPFIITTFDPPGSVYTYPVSINPTGAITGNYCDTTTCHGFLRAPNGEFTTFDVPNADQGTYPESISPAGAITGQYCNATACGSFLRDPHGTITVIDVPGAIYTKANCIDPEGAITGFWQDGSFVDHAFLRSPNGTLSTLDIPGAVTGPYLGTHAVGINAAGWIAGWYTVNTVGAGRGYLRAPGGKITTFAAPDGGTGVNLATGQGQGTYELGFIGNGSSVINLAAAITGYYFDPSNALHGFLRTPQGAIAEFDVGPAGVDPSTGNPYGTAPSTINLEGAIVGYYLDANFVNHGFLRAPQGRITELDVPSAGAVPGQYQGTVACSNNLAGVITGFWIDASNVVHGFLAIPIP